MFSGLAPAEELRAVNRKQMPGSMSVRPAPGAVPSSDVPAGGLGGSRSRATSDTHVRSVSQPSTPQRARLTSIDSGGDAFELVGREGTGHEQHPLESPPIPTESRSSASSRAGSEHAPAEQPGPSEEEIREAVLQGIDTTSSTMQFESKVKRLLEWEHPLASLRIAAMPLLLLVAKWLSGDGLISFLLSTHAFFLAACATYFATWRSMIHAETHAAVIERVVLEKTARKRSQGGMDWLHQLFAWWIGLFVLENPKRTGQVLGINVLLAIATSYLPAFAVIFTAWLVAFASGLLVKHRPWIKQFIQTQMHRRKTAAATASSGGRPSPMMQFVHTRILHRKPPSSTVRRYVPVDERVQ
jgi:hypothetical protein